MAYLPLGCKENGRGVIGEEKLYRAPRTPELIAADLAAAHVTPDAIAEVVTVDFQAHEIDLTAEQAV